MPCNVAYDPRATDDIDRAYRWYFRRSPNAAKRFLSAIHKAELRIGAYPLGQSRFGPRHRVAFLQKFPYLVVFRDKSDPLVIVGVSHTSRSSRFWERRLKP